MQDSELTAWIQEASRELAELAATAGARALVPACPGWTMRQLVADVISGLSGWYTYNLTHGAGPLDYSASWNSQPELPRRNAERLTRLVEASDEFAELVATIDLDAPCYVFQSRRTARAWLQRAATETAIHLRDAQEVLDEVTAWPAERAAASIDETLRIMWHGALLLRGDLGAERVPDDAITVAATDLDLAWQVRKASDDFVVEHVEPSAAPSSLSVAGRSDDLIPWLWGRAPTSRPAVTGDTAPRRRLEPERRHLDPGCSTVIASESERCRSVRRSRRPHCDAVRLGGPRQGPSATHTWRSHCTNSDLPGTTWWTLWDGSQTPWRSRKPL